MVKDACSILPFTWHLPEPSSAIRSEPNTKPTLAQDTKFCPRIQETPTGFRSADPHCNSSCAGFKHGCSTQFGDFVLGSPNFNNSQTTNSLPSPTLFSPGVNHTYSNRIFVTVIQLQLEPIFIFSAQELQACLYVTRFFFWEQYEGLAYFSAAQFPGSLYKIPFPLLSPGFADGFLFEL